MPPVSADDLRLPAGTTASLRADEALGEAFALTDLRDRVVIMLLFDQVVREDQVELAWQLWQQMRRDGAREPLWRVLTLFPDLDRELVYAEAARVYGFEEARIQRPVALAAIHALERRLPRRLWNQLVELRVAPIAEAEQPHKHTPRLVFATQDPTRPELHRLLPQLDLPGFELRYAREGEVVNLLVEAFPQRYGHLKGLSGVTRDLLSGAGFDDLAEEPAAPPEPEARDSGSALHVFEETLVEAVREHATDVCFLPAPDGRLEVYFQHGKDVLRRQHILDRPPAPIFVTAVKSHVIFDSATSADRMPKRVLQRWIDGARVGFRVSAVPPSEEVHAECIVVHLAR